MISDCNVIDNTAYHGGGLFASASNGTIATSLIANNIAPRVPEEPAQPEDPEQPPQSEQPTISGRGGGLFCFASLIDIVDSTLTNNRANTSGGAIYFTGSDQDITDTLYGGDIEMRIKQEIVLGIGGMRALAALGIRPMVFHMNEGHSAFLGLERIRMLMQERGVSFHTAREAVVASNVFTTHTPVPAGNDVFEPWLIDKYFRNYWTQLGLSREEFLALGRQEPTNKDEPMNLTVLALRFSSSRNGVSRLHSEVSRNLWAKVWPGVPTSELPLAGITNGVHTRSWISHDMAELYDRYLGPGWHEKPADQAVWRAVERIPDTELWRTHERRRERLVAFARRRVAGQLSKRGAGAAELASAEELLDPEALTIGFARRFARL